LRGTRMTTRMAMPKSKTPSKKASKSTEPAPTPLEQARQVADALCRAAHECYHQHERSARVFERTQVPAEEQAAEQICSVCDTALETLTTDYEQIAAHLHPKGSDAEWWHRANALWLASREFTRRRRSGDVASRSGPGKHAAHELESMHVEFELEASSLLALRQACEDYSRARPNAL
jgi:hypothetical protein